MDSVSELVPVSLVKTPAPEMTPERVCALEEENSKVEPAARLMLPAYVPLPNEPLAPICKVPALRVVLPE